MRSLRARGAALRTWRPQDACAIASICADPEACAWDELPWEHDAAALRAWVDRQRAVHAAGERISLAIADPTSGAAFGWIGLTPHAAAPGTWSIGYWVLPAARRRGHALRAARALTGHALAAGTARRILLQTGEHNLASQAVARHLGGRLLGRRAVVDLTGAEHEHLVYEIRSGTRRYVPGRTDSPEPR